jgi:hypothetical protein
MSFWQSHFESGPNCRYQLLEATNSTVIRLPLGPLVVAQYPLSRVLTLSVTHSWWVPDHFSRSMLQLVDLGLYARSWRHLDLLDTTRTPLGRNHLAVTAADAVINHWGLVAAYCEAAAALSRSLFSRFVSNCRSDDSTSTINHPPVGSDCAGLMTLLLNLRTNRGWTRSS